MYPFEVCSLAEVTERVDRLRPARVVSLLDPGCAFPVLGGVSGHLRLSLLDVPHADAAGAATRQTVEALLEFDGTAAPDALTLVHCHAGVSRSTAATLVLVARRYGARALPAAVDWLWRSREEVYPNTLLLALGDEVLGLSGSLARAGRVLKQRWRDVHGGGYGLS